MWQNEQGYFNGYPNYQRNCSNPACLNPYCRCGESCRCDHNHQCHGGGNLVYTQQKVNLSNSMRSVWEQHVYWTRMTIISIAFWFTRYRRCYRSSTSQCCRYGGFIKTLLWK